MKSEFVIERQGKQFVLYAGLLDEAHTQGLKRINTMLIQAPTESNGNVAICSAEVETEKGTYSGIGDASPENVKQSMANCLIRMAETRAKARALRDAVNVGVAALEELEEDEHPSPKDLPVATVEKPASNGNGRATEAQLKAIYSIGKARLGLSDAQVRVKCHNAFRKYPDMLSKGEASELIDFLKQTQPVN